jgi:hypothetical protein
VPVELVDVQPDHGVRGEVVGARPPDDQLGRVLTGGFQRPAQRVDRDVQAVAGRARLRARPQHVHQPFGGQRTAVVQRQRAQHGPGASRAPPLHRDPVHPDLERTEQPQLNRGGPAAVVGRCRRPQRRAHRRQPGRPGAARSGIGEQPVQLVVRVPQSRQLGFVGCPVEQRGQHPVRLRVVTVVEQREHAVDEIGCGHRGPLPAGVAVCTGVECGRGAVLIPGDRAGITRRRRTYLPP